MEDWVVFSITIFVSGFVGYVIPYTILFFQFVVNRFIFRKKELLEGTWHVYHFTRMRMETVLRHEKWVIKRNLLNKLIVKTEDPKNPDLKYEGIISTERNYLLILLKGVRHKEEGQMRFFDIIPTGQDMAFGLTMGVDFDNEPQCIVRVMSRKELDEEEARKILRTKTIMKDNVILGISK